MSIPAPAPEAEFQAATLERGDDYVVGVTGDCRGLYGRYNVFFPFEGGLCRNKDLGLRVDKGCFSDRVIKKDLGFKV